MVPMIRFALMALLVSVAACGSAVQAQNPPAQTTAPSGVGAPPTQKSNTKAAPKAPSRKSQQRVPDDGSVTDGLYSEKFFDLRYSIPQGWVVRTPEMWQGIAQEGAVLLLSAFGKQSPASGEVNPSVTITAENLSLYPEAKTVNDYFQSLSDLVKSKGFSVLNEPAQIDMAGVTFLRGDFQKQEGELTTYQATMVAFRKGYVLQVTAITGDEEQLTPMLNRLHIFAPPTMRRTP